MNYEIISFIWRAYTIPLFGILYGLSTIISICCIYLLIKNNKYTFIGYMFKGILGLLILESILEILIKTSSMLLSSAQITFASMFFCLFLQVPHLFYLDIIESKAFNKGKKQ